MSRSRSGGVHDVADDDHSDIGRRLLDEYAPSQADRERVLKVVDAYKDVVFLMYEEIYKKVQAVQ